MTSIDEGGVLSRTSILALYSSPLVPNKLEGMKELSEWYGEYSTPPSPPIQRSQLSSTSRQNSSSVVPQSTTTGGRDGGGGGNHRRLTPFNSDSNPFANFGRFGVDGGLMGEPLEMPRRRGGGKGAGAGEDGGKDLAPHLQQISGGGSSPAMSNRKTKEDGTTSGALPWSTTGDSKRDSFLKEERNNRAGLTSTRGNTGNGENEPRRRGGGLGNGVESGSTSAKDRRGLGPADEGGWRSVGTTREEREKRLLRNQANSTGATDSPRRFDRERRDNHERGGGDRDRDRDRSEREPYSSRGGRGGPAWMTDEDSNSTAPTWMDSSARKDGLETSGGGGGGAIAEDEAILDVGTPTKKGADWQASSGPGGMDSIQQWKMQMKEIERKERERDLKDAGIEVPSQAQEERHEPESVFSALTSPKPEPASTKSIFEDLGIVRSPAVTPAAPPGLTAPPGLQGPNPEQAAGAGPGGRASRFAKFFDGKPQSPVTQAQQPPPSVFGALMGGGGPTDATNSASPGPSKEDAESMARLMGMLQVQGTRTESPIARQQAPVEPTPSGYTSPAPHPEPAAPIPQSQPPAAEESRSSSRFKFSSSTARTASPSIGTRSVPASQPQSAVHSPTASNQSIPPPPAPPGFGGYPAGPPPSQSRAPLNHLPAALSPADRMRSPPLPLPQSQQQQQNYNNRSRTVSTTSELGSRPPSSNHLNHLPASSPLPLPLSMTHQQPQQAQQHHLNQNNSGPLPPSAFPPQFYNGQRIPPPGPHGLSMGMYPPGANGQIPPPPPQSMMNPEILRNLAAVAAGNGMRSPPLPGHSHPTSLPPQQQGPGMSYGGPPLPPHGGMVPPHQGLPPPRGQQQMMFAPPPHPSQYPPPGGRPGMQGPGIGMSMGGNAGADLMALLNSGGNGGIRIGGQGPPPHPHQQQGNLPPFLMEGR